MIEGCAGCVTCAGRTRSLLDGPECSQGSVAAEQVRNYRYQARASSYSTSAAALIEISTTRSPLQPTSDALLHLRPRSQNRFSRIDFVRAPLQLGEPGLTGQFRGWRFGRSRIEKLLDGRTHGFSRRVQSFYSKTSSTVRRHPGSAGSASAVSPRLNTVGEAGLAAEYLAMVSASGSTSHTVCVPARK